MLQQMLKVIEKSGWTVGETELYTEGTWSTEIELEMESGNTYHYDVMHNQTAKEFLWDIRYIITNFDVEDWADIQIEYGMSDLNYKELLSEARKVKRKLESLLKKLEKCE